MNCHMDGQPGPPRKLPSSHRIQFWPSTATRDHVGPRSAGGLRRQTTMIRLQLGSDPAVPRMRMAVLDAERLLGTRERVLIVLCAEIQGIRAALGEWSNS